MTHKRMKVAIIAPDKLPIPNTKGGAIETLSTHWINKNEEYGCIDITVFSPYEKKAEIISNKYLYTRVKFYKSNLFVKIHNKLWAGLYRFSRKRIIPIPGFVLQIKSDLKKLNPDVIIAEGSYPQVPLLEKLRKPVVLHIHTDVLNNTVPGCEIIISKCKKIWTNSDYIKHQVVGGCRITDKVRTLPNAIDTKQFLSGDGNQIRKKYGIPNDCKVIIYCGRIDPIKGVKELILAFEKTEINNMFLLIVGGSRFAGSEMSNYESNLRDYVLQHNLKVIFTGFIFPEQLPSFYHAADFSICPSICNEAAGLVILEARSAGLPVIATNKGGIPEYVNPNSSILIDYNQETFIDDLSNAICRMNKELEESENLKVNSRLGVEKFDIDTYYWNFVSYLEEIS